MNRRSEKTKEMHRTGPSLVDCWAGAVKAAAENALEICGASAKPADATSERRQWFDLWGRASEVYLRSPEFLSHLKHHVDTLIEAKRLAGSDCEGNDSASGRLLRDAQSMATQFEQFLKEVHLEQSGQRGATRSDPERPAIDRPPKWATPSQVVYQSGQLKLLHFSPENAKFAEPILICFALVNRPYILDLQEDRSVVRRLIDSGFDVYVIDWGAPQVSDSTLRLEDYVGSCMGGTMSAIYTALHPACIGNLILMATPIDFQGHNGLLSLWSRRETFDVDGLIDAFGNCPGEFLQFVFQLMKPVQNFAEKQLTYWENCGDRKFQEDFETIERWSKDCIPVAGATFREFVQMLYQQNRLVRGRMELAGRRVRLEAIACPLLLLVAEKDHLVPPASTLAIEGIVSSQDVTSLSIRAGHIGLAVGSQAQRDLWPQAADWIARHSTEI
jgi:polyhydroxyalkanoate synthase